MDIVTANVRRATKNEIPVLVELMRDFYAESKFSLDGDWAVRSFDQLLQSTERGAAWISFRGSDPAGYVVLTTRHSMEFGGLDGFVDDLFVRPAFRRQGVGASLLTELLRECSKRRVLAVHIEVGSDNAPAQALCRRFGLSNNGRQLFTARVA
jgi:ribosomal protein S18 acetylase RimI-like enzyme